uniref:BHLH domain-containing protein n=1 Tax=Elaeophora elaphi TaxID=1147741 RepID=A0A0R3RTU8_9BILA
MRNGVEAKVSSKSTSMKKRSQSNRKERRRNEEMNLAYARLQRCVPHIPHDQKLAKIKTLRLATLYIKHLEAVRSSSSQELRPLELEDFASIAMAEIQARNNYKDLAEKELQRGIRTEDICRQSVTERYTLQQTSPDNYFPSVTRPDLTSPTILHSNATATTSTLIHCCSTPSIVIPHNSPHISTFSGQYLIDNLYYFPFTN